VKVAFGRVARGNLIAVFGVIVVAVLLFTAIFAEQLSPHDPNAQIGARLSPPSGEFLLGLDQLGRDVLSRLIFGARVSLEVSLTSVGLATFIGGGVGLISGYYGGILDDVLMRAMDVLFTLPSFVLAIALTGILGASLINVIIAISIVTTPSVARVIRGPVLSVREREFVTSARAVGASHGRIMLRHILPNVAAPVIVQATVSMAEAILIEAGLSFLGLGVPPPDHSWGNMLGIGRGFIELANGLSIFPGVAIMVAVLGFNLAGDGLRDVLDPQLRGV
jgi:peptide/nickel transport system permease protein